jgi:integrase
MLLVQNVHPRVVMELLGHSHTSMTLDICSHVFPAAKRETADRTEAILAGGRAAAT